MRLLIIGLLVFVVLCSVETSQPKAQMQKRQERDAFYAGPDKNIKFVRFEGYNGRPVWINLAHIASIETSIQHKHEGETEITMIHRGPRFSKEPIEQLISRIRETVEFDRKEY